MSMYFPKDIPLFHGHWHFLADIEDQITGLDKDEKEKLLNVIIKAMKDIKYRGAGTIEMLYENKKFYFISGNEITLMEKIKSIIVEGYKLKENAQIKNIDTMVAENSNRGCEERCNEFDLCNFYIFDSPYYYYFF